MPHLTPGASTDNAALVIIVPANLMRDVLGSLAQLAQPSLWEAWGDVSVDDAAAAIQEALDFMPVEYGILLADSDGAILLDECGDILTIASD